MCWNTIFHKILDLFYASVHMLSYKLLYSDLISLLHPLSLHAGERWLVEGYKNSLFSLYLTHIFLDIVGTEKTQELKQYRKLLMWLRIVFKVYFSSRKLTIREF